MPIITGFDVAIGTTDTWLPVVVVAVDQSRTLRNSLPGTGKEYRYWRVKVIENGVEEEVEGRLLIAGSLHPNPPIGSVIVAPGEYLTWTRVRNIDEDIITLAGTLSVT